MPCFDAQAAEDDRIAHQMASVLCGLTTKLGPDAVRRLVDWEEAGVSVNHFDNWWKEHQRRDEERQRSRDRSAAHSLSKLPEGYEYGVAALGLPMFFAKDDVEVWRYVAHRTQNRPWVVYDKTGAVSKKFQVTE